MVAARIALCSAGWKIQIPDGRLNAHFESNDGYYGGNHGGVVINGQDYLVDGNAPLQDDTFTRCDFLDIVDEYDVVQKVNGKAEVLMSNRIIYRLQPFGACTIEHHATVRRDCHINLWAQLSSTFFNTEPRSIKMTTKTLMLF